jgi:hypothetical protein
MPAIDEMIKANQEYARTFADLDESVREDIAGQ